MPVESQQYPVNLVLEGRPVLVVGGGHIAVRKVAGLLACGASVTVVAPVVDPELESASVLIERRAYRRGEVAGYRLVVATTDDPAVNRTVFEDAEEAGVWCNSADDPANCSYTLPAILRRGPIAVTVSTGGHSPALASWLRSRLAEELGPEYEVLAELLSAERDAIKARGGSTEGLDWRSALDSEMLELIRAGKVNSARERLQACLFSSSV
jgi:siroheme synthase-like protein